MDDSASDDETMAHSPPARRQSGGVMQAGNVLDAHATVAADPRAAAAAAAAKRFQDAQVGNAKLRGCNHSTLAAGPVNKERSGVGQNLTCSVG